MKAATTETLGQRLARLRAAANMTQDELADKASVAVASMRNWEQDHRRPRADAALRLARALGVTMEELLVLPSSRPSRSDVQDPPGVRALKRAWARAKMGERQEFLEFVKQEGGKSSDKKTRSRSEILSKRRTGKAP